MCSFRCEHSLRCETGVTLQSVCDDCHHFALSGLRLNLGLSQERRRRFDKSAKCTACYCLKPNWSQISPMVIQFYRVLKSSTNASLAGQYYRNSLTSGPSENGHFQSTVGRQKGGLQGQVGHGAGAALRVDPALNGLPFIRVTVCRQKTTTKHLNWKRNVQSSRLTPLDAHRQRSRGPSWSRAWLDTGTRRECRSRRAPSSTPRFSSWLYSAGPETLREHKNTSTPPKTTPPPRGTLECRDQYICANRTEVVCSPVPVVSHSFWNCRAETGTNVGIMCGTD